MTFRRSLSVLSLLATSVVLGGCFVVADVDRFKEEPVNTDPFQALDFNARGLTTHTAQLFELQIIDAQNFIQCRGYIEPFGTVDSRLQLPRAVPRDGGPYRLDFYADKNHSGNYDGIDPARADHDHAWRVEPLADFPTDHPNDGIVQVEFIHNTSFVELNEWPTGTANPARTIGQAAKIHLAGFQNHAGKLVEVRLRDSRTGRTVGFYRWPNLPAQPNAEYVIPGVIDGGEEYDVDLYVDANGNQQYEDPTKPNGDLGFRSRVRSGDTGLDVTVDAEEAGAPVDVGPP